MKSKKNFYKIYIKNTHIFTHTYIHIKMTIIFEVPDILQKHCNLFDSQLIYKATILL